nr:hypothetical protein [Tanacetum cinerariifolium]
MAGFMYSVDENLAFRHLESNLNILSLTSVASSEGVWCFAFGENSMLLLWNPSIKKSIGISVPNYTFQPDSPKMIFGFGIRPITPEPTLLKINYLLYIAGPWDCRIIYAWALEVEGRFVSSCSLLFTIPHSAGHYHKLLGFSKDNQPIVEATIVQQWKVNEDVSKDDHFMQGPWLQAIVYLHGQGVIVFGCLGDMKKHCIKGKLELVVGVVKSCTPNSLGGMTVTLKDPTGTMKGTIHYKVFQNEYDGYAKSIKVGYVLILCNVSVWTPKPSQHYLNITIRKNVKVFNNDTEF